MEQYIEPEKSYPSQNSQHTAAKSQYAKASNPQPRSACLELKKEFVHMLNSESSAGSETVLEKDFILPDSAEDMVRILLIDPLVCTEEATVGENRMEFKGNLQVNFLYQSDINPNALCRQQFKIPFREVVKLDGLNAADKPEWEINVDKFSLLRVNERKAVFKGTLEFSCVLGQIRDEEIVTGIVSDEECEIRTEQYQCLSLSGMKNDLFRIREEMKLPASAPAVSSIIWQSLSIRNFEAKPLREQLAIRGELNAFIIYTDETEQTYFKESTIPFHGTLECDGCDEDSIVNVSYSIDKQLCEIRPDDEGEDRNISLEVNLKLYIKVFENMRTDCMSDAYAGKSELILDKKEISCFEFLTNSMESFRIDQMVPVPSENERIDEILHASFDIEITSVSRDQNNLLTRGNLCVQLFFTVTDDRFPYRSSTFKVPFTHSSGISGLSPDTEYRIQGTPENISVTIFDTENLQFKAVVMLNIFAMNKINHTSVSCVTSIPNSSEKRKKSYGITVFFPDKNNNTLWEVGKETGIPLSRIRSLNHLSPDAETYKDKIIVMK